MNGMKPKFLEDVQLDQEYFQTPNPYRNAPSCHVNLLEMSGYAKKNGKMIELTKVEV